MNPESAWNKTPKFVTDFREKQPRYDWCLCRVSQNGGISVFGPYNSKDEAKQDKNYILDRMREQGLLFGKWYTVPIHMAKERTVANAHIYDVLVHIGKRVSAVGYFETRNEAKNFLSQQETKLKYTIVFLNTRSSLVTKLLQ